MVFTVRFVIIADTHDNIPLIAAAVSVANEKKADYVLHCGDYIAPFTAGPFRDLKAKFVGVFGNNDGDRPALIKAYKDIGRIYPDPHRIKLDEISLLITHKPHIANDAALMGGYDLVAYGHEHRVRVEQGLTLIVCPGETGGWVTGRPTAVVADMPSREIEIVELKPRNFTL